MATPNELREMREIRKFETQKIDFQISGGILLTSAVVTFLLIVFLLRKRINRINYIIYYISTFILFILSIVWIGEIDKYSVTDTVNIYTIVGFSAFIIFSINLFILNIKRGHDFGRDITFIIIVCLIPLHQIYLILKKGDNKANKYGNTDDKIIFFNKDKKKRKNIFETIFYNPVIGPYLKEEGKDEIIKKSSGRLLVVLYSIVYPVLVAFIFLIGKSADIDLNDEEIFIYILFFTIAYKFSLKAYFIIEKYIKSNS